MGFPNFLSFTHYTLKYYLPNWEVGLTNTTPINPQDKDGSSPPCPLTLGGVPSISIAFPHTERHQLWFFSPELSIEFQCTYLMSLWECSTKISHTSFIFPSTPASPLASLLLFMVLAFVQAPSSNTLSCLCLLFLLPKLQRCSVQCPPLRHIHIHISLVRILLTLLSQLSSVTVPDHLGRSHTNPVKKSDPS